jgi:hypothetical protein
MQSGGLCGAPCGSTLIGEGTCWINPHSTVECRFIEHVRFLWLHPFMIADFLTDDEHLAQELKSATSVKQAQAGPETGERDENASLPQL